MNKEKIKAAALALRVELAKHINMSEFVTALANMLEPLLVLATEEKILEPMYRGDIPGGYLFTEYGLDAYKDLANAYANFCIQLTDSQDLVDALEARRGKLKPE